MIDTVIFDIGGVLVRFDELRYMQDILKNNADVEYLCKSLAQSTYWDDMDRGEDVDEILKKLIADDPDYEKQIRTVFDNYGQCISREDYSIPWIRGLKERGYRVLYLSNYSTYVMDIKPDVLDFIEYMDGGIFSCYVNMVKPEPGIYQALIDKYDLKPENCIFIDDSPENVEAACSLGMRAICFDNYRQTSSDLEEMLQKV